MRYPKKHDFPVGEVRRYLEPGPIVLVTSRWQGKNNVMTLGWHTVLEFSPSLVGLMISSGRKFLFDQWWVATMPGLAIFTVSLGFNLLGDGLRDVLDPRSASK